MTTRTKWQNKTLIILLFCSFPVLADYTIENTSSNSSISAYLSETLGQSFTTTAIAGSSIESVELEFDGLNNLCDGLELRIYSGNQTPNNPAIARYTETFTGLATAGWVSLALSERVPVQANTQYTLEFESVTTEQMWIKNNLGGNPYGGGHSWQMGTARPNDDLAFRVNIHVPTIGAGYAIEQTATSGAANKYYHGQSFTTVAAGFLTQLEINVEDPLSVTGLQLRIYTGNQNPGDPSQALYVENFTGLTSGWYAMTLSNRLFLEANTQYSFELTTGSSNTYWLRAQWSDVYSGGHAWMGLVPYPDYDLAFRLHIDAVPTVRICYLDSDQTSVCDNTDFIDQDQSAFADDLDGSGYSEGQCLVSIASSPDPAEDQLSLDTSGDVWLGGTTAGSSVGVSGTVIGSLGNSIQPGNDLLIELNGAATDGMLSTLLQAVTYEDVDLGTNRTPGVRVLRATVTDATGDTSLPADVEVTVFSLPTATVGGSQVICENDGATIEVALTGIPPWEIMLSDGTVYTGISTSPVMHPVSPLVSTAYSVPYVADSHCENTGTGEETITVHPRPTALLSGDAVICMGDTTPIQVDLTGTPPWSVSFSDGSVFPNVIASPLIHLVSPDVTTAYTVTALADVNCAGNAAGTATVTVNEFDVLTDPTHSVAQGVAIQELEAMPQCETPPFEIEWTVLATGYSFGLNTNPIAIDPIPPETTDYQARLSDELTRDTVTRVVRLLVAVNALYFDLNGDVCNDLADLWLLCPFWRMEAPLNDDPDGSGCFDILDFLYINLDDSYPCAAE